VHYYIEFYRFKETNKQVNTKQVHYYIEFHRFKETNKQVNTKQSALLHWIS